MDFIPTHLTRDLTPVQVTHVEETTQEAVARTRMGLEMVRPVRDLIPMGSAEALDLLGQVFQVDAGQAEAEAIQDRMTLANWAKCLGNARDTLAEGISKALQGNISPGVQATLQKALRDALEDLADFSR